MDAQHRTTRFVALFAASLVGALLFAPTGQAVTVTSFDATSSSVVTRSDWNYAGRRVDEAFADEAEASRIGGARLATAQAPLGDELGESGSAGAWLDVGIGGGAIRYRSHVESTTDYYEDEIFNYYDPYEPPRIDSALQTAGRATNTLEIEFEVPTLTRYGMEVDGDFGSRVALFYQAENRPVRIFDFVRNGTISPFLQTGRLRPGRYTFHMTHDISGRDASSTARFGLTVPGLVTPEPSTALLLGLGLCGLAQTRQRASA